MGLLLRILGELTVSQDGRALELPASRKARALLAYLALMPRAVTRCQLCGLLWDTANDPRGELRWCLSRLRPIVGATRIDCREDFVRLDLADSLVDALEIQHAAQAGIGTLEPERAHALLRLFNGDLLEGLEVDHCPVFTSWVLAQRRRFRAWRIALIERLVQGAPNEHSFGHVEQWLELAPLDVRAHEHMLAALVRRGRLLEAKEHLATSIKLFSTEDLDCAPLRRAWRAVMQQRTGVLTTTAASCADARAHDYYLQGRQYLARMMKQGLKASREMFVRAIELDADYAQAWAGLAIVHACLSEWFDGGRVSLSCAEQTSRRALELAPQAAEAHVARGFARSLSRHYDEAVCEFEEAIRIDPYLFDAYYYYARTAFARGDMSLAGEMFGLAAQLRPEDFQSPVLLGSAMRALGRDDPAGDAVRIGIRRAEQVLARDRHDGRALSLGAGALIEDGQTERALEWSRCALDLYPDDTSALVNVACVHAQVGQSTEALDLLERVFAQGCGKRDWVMNDPDYNILRSEPRFQRLLSRLR